MARAGLSPVLLMVLSSVIAFSGCPETRSPSQAFTAEEVAELQALLKTRDFTPSAVTLIKSEALRTDPQNYRLVLPTFTRDEKDPSKVVVGSETVGRLPVTEVKRLASLRNVEYKETSNAQAIIFQNAEQGGAPGGGSGGGNSGSGGCEQDHSTAAKGQDIAARINEILLNINQSKYVFLY